MRRRTLNVLFQLPSIFHSLLLVTDALKLKRRAIEQKYKDKPKQQDSTKNSESFINSPIFVFHYISATCIYIIAL